MANTYYVDLAKSYDDNGSDFNNRLYDDFEDGSIDSGFDADFRTKYNVQYIYDERVATGTENARIIDGIGDGNFSVELSFVRGSDNAGEPVYLSLNFDASTVGVLLWDYENSRIRIATTGGSYAEKYGNFVKELKCPNSLKKMSVKFVYDGTLSAYYKVSDDWILLCDSIPIPDSFTEAYIEAMGATDAGFGYIDIQADVSSGTTLAGHGTEDYPFTYTEFYTRVRPGGTGETNDIYKLRNHRIIGTDEQSSFYMNEGSNYTLDAWDALVYGPWLMAFNGFYQTISFVGSTIKNGIIYNIPSDGNSDLIITNAYDMFMTWNAPQNRIGFIRRYNEITDDVRADIFGCTIKTEGGSYTDTQGRR